MIDYSGKNPRYFDKNGTEIHDGDSIRYPSGRIAKVYLTDENNLGTDATNPVWIAAGRAAPCEYGIYPLESHETDEVEVVKQ